jgi:NAD(P)-dependent dehydrogenase (short-subunit alcohol dehydrogenase family)
MRWPVCGKKRLPGNAPGGIRIFKNWERVMRAKNRFEGKVVVITGASSGIGEKMALLFGDEGAALVLMDVNKEGLERTRTQLEKGGHKAIAVQANVAKSDEVNRAIEEAVAASGKIDVLVNNAGISKDAFIHKMTDEDWDDVIGVDLTGVFHCCRAVVPHMKAQKSGKIISISSAAIVGNVGVANYNSAKAGIVGLTRVLALELAPNITANAVAPGFVDTPLVRKYPEKIRNVFLESVPLKRAAQPEDIGHAILFLASDEANYITGQTIFVCGGMSIGI